ncbi:MAG: LCP family protein [Clostridia bacterium]
MSEKKSTRVVKKQKKKTSKLKIIFILFILISIVSGIMFAMQIQKNGGGLKGFLLTTLGSNRKSLEELDTIYILALGVSTDLNSNLTDTIMLCGYNPKTNQAMMLSIPRDTFIGTNKNRARGNDKINSLYAKGVDKTVEAVEELTGIDIDYYAVINNDLLIQMVDVIGGVDFEVPIDMDYDDPTQDLHIHLKKGMQRIDGEKAEQLLRFRHNNDGSSYPYEYGDNDYGRMRTQREFMKSTMGQVVQTKNLLKSKKILETVMDNLDTDMRIEDILPYIPYTVDLDFNNIRMEQLPGESELCNKVWVYIHSKSKTTELVEDLTNMLENGYTQSSTENNIDE